MKKPTAESERKKPNVLRSFVKAECALYFDGYCPGGDPLEHTIFNDTGECLILNGKPCPYFRDWVLPLAKQRSSGSDVFYKYALIDPLLKKKKQDVRRCECGKALLPNHRYCPKCRRKHYLASKRDWKRAKTIESR